MRELKFRVWWKDTKRFLDGDEWYMTCSGAKHLHYSVYPYSDDDFVIEQYTGLKDKNGKEIYEGDIVNDAHHVCEIIWFDNFCKFIATNEDEGYSSDVWYMAKYGEVIGNIHENPELLEEK